MWDFFPWLGQELPRFMPWLAGLLAIVALWLAKERAAAGDRAVALERDRTEARAAHDRDLAERERLAIEVKVAHERELGEAKAALAERERDIARLRAEHGACPAAIAAAAKDGEHRYELRLVTIKAEHLRELDALRAEHRREVESLTGRLDAARAAFREAHFACFAAGLKRSGSDDAVRRLARALGERIDGDS